MKKTTAIALCVAMLCGMAGCNTKQNEKENGGDITLKVYMPAAQQKDLSLVLEEANKMIEPAIGAKIDMVFIDQGSYTEKMNMKLATKEYFDVCFTSNWLNPYGKGLKNHCYYPLTELIDKNCPELWDTMPQYWWDGAKVKGEIYAVPNQQVAATAGAFTLNKKWVEKYNLDLDSIKSIDDFEPFFDEIVKNEPNYYALRTSGNFWENNYKDIASMVGVDLRDTDSLKAIYEWDADGFMNGLEKLRQYYEKGYIRKDVASVLDDINDFKANKYVVTSTGWKPGFEATQSAQLGGEHVAVITREGMVDGSTLTSTMYAISANSKYPDKSIKFINLMNTNKELYNLICNGIEGKHYKWADDEHIELISDGGYYVNASWEFGNQFNAYPLVGQDADVWEKTKEFNENLKVSPIISFSFDSSSVQTELSQMATVVSEYKNMLMYGCADWRKDFDGFKDKMMAAGAENVLNELQKQLDEYAKTNK